MTRKLGYTIKEFCAAVGISRRTLYTLWQRNQGPPRGAIGGRVIIPAEGGEQWLRDQLAT